MYLWNMAADIYSFSDKQIENAVYYNSKIERFMKSYDSMGISACKGMGKTFLLKAKRMGMMKNQSYFILPKDQLVDTPGPIILNKSQIRFLSSYTNWVALWEFCICAYILSQDEFSSIREEYGYNELPDEIKEFVDNKNDGVFHVLSRLLVKNEISLLRKSTELASALFQLTQRINRQVVLFVDKIEEPFNRGYYKIAGSSTSAEGKYNNSIWAYAQLAFAEAVYILYSGRHHIKVFYSIRQEALYGGEQISIEFSKISKEMITKIEYSYDDLEKMFNRYISLEKDDNLFFPYEREKNPCLALCGISKLRHRSGKSESLWAYIYRHSLGRPRDIMEIGIALHDNIVDKYKNSKVKKDVISRECRHWINQISTRICKEYIHCLEPFMGYDENIVFSQKLENFLSLLPTNVFSHRSSKAYCRMVNCNNCSYECCSCNSNCSCCNNIHYFSTLYNIGLLGYVYKSTSELGYKISIKHIGDSIFSSSEQTLPKGELYYMHPGIGNMIQEIRERNLQKYVSSNIIINSCQTFIDDQQLLRLQHLSDALLGNSNNNKVFVTSTERHLKNERDRIINFLKDRGYEVMAFEDPEFPSMPLDTTGLGATHDHCIDVALSCGHLIYIFDGSFGGHYAGKGYRCYVEDNKETIKINPSISFMEYLIAKTYNKDVAVYVLSEVDTARGEYIANGKPEEYRSNVTENNKAPEVFAQLGYFNSLGNGTWYNKYSNISELEKYLDVRFPQL